MMLSNVFIMGLFSLAVYAKISTLDEEIKEEFSRITRYELTHFDLSSFESQNIISFDTLNKHYRLKLTVNPFIIMGQIDHMNPGVDYGSNNLNTSCHYHGTLLNTDGPSSVALSMCPGRGIRGSIRLPNDRLEINPSRHFFEGELSRTRDRGDEIHDEHLIYKISDFNSTGYHPKFTHIRAAIKNQLKGAAKAIRGGITGTNNRRRLGSSNTVETYMFSDPSYTRFKGGSSRAQSACADVLNKVTGLYAKASWSIGRISFKFSGFDAISSYSGSFRGLRPGSVHGKVDAGDLLIKMQNWIPRNIDTRRYDAFHTLTSEDIATAQTKDWLGGLASGNTMCGGLSVGVSKSWGASTTDLAMIAAHELGHNFGMPHDSGSCGTGYIMGPGGGKGWSSCSRSALKSHCRSKSNCGCLDGSGGSGHDNLEGWGFTNEEEDTECLEREQYAQKICVHQNGEKQEYRLSDESCVNERGVYLHEKYELHWRPERGSYRNGSWIITAVDATYTALAECKGEWHALNEKECGHKKWTVRGFDEDQVLMMDDETLWVMDGACDGSGDSVSDTMHCGWMWIVVAVVGIVVVVAIVLLVFYNIRRKRHKVVQKMIVPDDDDEEEEAEEEEEIEMEVEVDQNTTMR